MAEPETQPGAITNEWAFLAFAFGRLFQLADGRLSTIETELKKLQETIMSRTDQIQADLNEVKANLTETQADITELKTNIDRQTEAITAAEATIADLRSQVGELAQLDVLAAQVQELKTTSRAIADMYSAAAPAAV